MATNEDPPPAQDAPQQSDNSVHVSTVDLEQKTSLDLGNSMLTPKPAASSNSAAPQPQSEQEIMQQMYASGASLGRPPMMAEAAKGVAHTPKAAPKAVQRATDTSKETLEPEQPAADTSNDGTKTEQSATAMDGPPERKQKPAGKRARGETRKGKGKERQIVKDEESDEAPEGGDDDEDDETPAKPGSKVTATMLANLQNAYNFDRKMPGHKQRSLREDKDAVFPTENVAKRKIQDYPQAHKKQRTNLLGCVRRGINQLKEWRTPQTFRGSGTNNVYRPNKDLEDVLMWLAKLFNNVNTKPQVFYSGVHDLVSQLDDLFRVENGVTRDFDSAQAINLMQHYDRAFAPLDFPAYTAMENGEAAPEDEPLGVKTVDPTDAQVEAEQKRLEDEAEAKKAADERKAALEEKVEAGKIARATAAKLATEAKEAEAELARMNDELYANETTFRLGLVTGNGIAKVKAEQAKKAASPTSPSSSASKAGPKAKTTGKTGTGARAPAKRRSKAEIELARANGEPTPKKRKTAKDDE